MLTKGGLSSAGMKGVEVCADTWIC